MIAAALLACAMNVSPVTLEAVVAVESGGNPLSLNVNRWSGAQPNPATVADAARIARGFVARGYSVDLGLMQINSRNLAELGLTIEQVLEPCANVHAGAAILSADYTDAARTRGEGQAALQAALSAYNTGSFARGFANGYVAKYFGPHTVPALAAGTQVPSRVVTAEALKPPAPASPFTSETQIYVREASNVVIN